MKFLKFHRDPQSKVRRKSVDQALRDLDDWFVKASPEERATSGVCVHPRGCHTGRSWTSLITGTMGRPSRSRV